jgi:hypothetical protein
VSLDRSHDPSEPAPMSVAAHTARRWIDSKPLGWCRLRKRWTLHPCNRKSSGV